MIKFGIARSLAIVVVSVAAICMADTANANNGSWGSRGFGSGGSWGGGSQGGFGSSGYGCSGVLRGARPVRNLLGRVRDRVSNSGCWGSRGGYASSGFSCCGGSFGQRVGILRNGFSTGGCTGVAINRCCPVNDCCSVNLTNNCAGCAVNGVAPLNSGVAAPTPADGQYYDPNMAVPAGGFPAETDVNPQDGQPPVPSPVEDDAEVDGQDTRFVPRSQLQEAVLSLKVPTQATVWINGERTTTPGSLRSYVSRQLKSGKQYKFNVKVAVDRGGKQVSMAKDIVMRGGLDRSLEFDFDKPQLTQLSLNVPKDAIVKLCGKSTAAIGGTRHYKTRTLLPGESWSDYEIQVSVVRDGKTRVSRRIIEIESGEQVTLDFDMDQDVAMYASK